MSMRDHTFNKLCLTAKRAFRRASTLMLLTYVFRCESVVHLQQLPHSDSFCLILPPNLKSAIAAVTYIAEQLKKQDMGDSVRIDTM